MRFGANSKERSTFLYTAETFSHGIVPMECG
jgi:hypothetical protein